MRKWMMLGLAALVASTGAAAKPRDSLDAAARDYVRLQLAIGEKEDGYIDAYTGPAALRAEGIALAKRNDPEALQRRAEQLRARVERLGAGSRSDAMRRARFLSAQLTAAVTRLRMLRGEKLSFDEEAEGLFAVRPQLKPLAAFDPVVARIDRLLPGPGPLWQRVDRFQERFVIPADKLRPVFDAAIAGCRARSIKHIPMPRGESFDLKFVTGKSWGGYNYYLGDYRSRIEINTDLPIRMSRAVDLGCHEGYPGHHVLNTLLEQKLTRGRGWIEFSVYPLFSPQSLLAEGTANYGIDLAFPGADKLTFEKTRLYPIAGLPVAEADRYGRLLDALKELGGVQMTLAREFLDGRIGEQEFVRLAQQYQLVSEKRARQSLAFAKQYRSYVINYGLGRDLVEADVESRRSDAERWKRFAEIISQPTLPSDLKPR